MHIAFYIELYVLFLWVYKRVICNNELNLYIRFTNIKLITMILGVFGAWQLIAIVFVLGLILLNVFYLLNLQDTLKEVGESRRQVPPSNVWLMFIPLFNLIYPFILYPKICDSVKAEFEYRGMNSKGDFGKGIGITLPILSLVSIIPYLGVLASIGHLVFFIIFWSKTAGYKNQLRTTPLGTNNSSSGSSTDLLDN